MTAPTRTCEACGTEFSKPPKRTWKEFEGRRFCSRLCTLSTVDRGLQRGTHCKSGRHELSGDNVRMSGTKRACKACATEKERERKARRRGTQIVRRTTRKPPPAPVVPAAPAPSERPVWRPAGFSPQPDTRRPA